VVVLESSSERCNALPDLLACLYGHSSQQVSRVPFHIRAMTVVLVCGLMLIIMSVEYAHPVSWLKTPTTIIDTGQQASPSWSCGRHVASGFVFT
jgi:hypothetical protein